MNCYELHVPDIPTLNLTTRLPQPDDRRAAGAELNWSNPTPTDLHTDTALPRREHPQQPNCVLDACQDTALNDKMNGQGTKTYANGDKYEGPYVDGKRDGQGIFTHANGNKYVGLFVDGRCTQGTYTYADGSVYPSREWNNLLPAELHARVVKEKADHWILNKPLVDVTREELVTLTERIEELEVCSDCLRSSKVTTGKLLASMQSADDLKDVGLPGFQARVLYSQLLMWKANGVERSLLVPAPAVSGGPPPLPAPSPYPLAPPPPQISSPSGKSLVLGAAGSSATLIGSMIKDGRRSSGASVLMNGSFTSAATRKAVNAKIKLMPSNNLSAVRELRGEFDIAKRLYDDSHSNFVRPYAFLDGAAGEILSEEGEDCTGFVGLAMERGGDNLAEFLKKKKHSLVELLPYAKSILHILDAAHEKCCVVLMDLKPENIVRFHDVEQDDYTLKAIDFDNSRPIDTEITMDATGTLAYISPEVARVMLARANKTTPVRTFATPAIDIFALGLIVFEMACEGKSLWEFFGIRVRPVVVDELALLNAAASLTDNKVKELLEKHLHLPLRSWLLDALKVEPAERWSAKLLLSSHSLFRPESQATHRVSSGLTQQLLDSVSKLATKEDMNDGFQKVHLSLEEMHEKLNAIASSQSDLGLVMRQAASDSAVNQGVLKRSLESLGASMQSSMSMHNLSSIEGMGASELQSLIKSAVSSSLQAAPGLTDDLKRFIKDTVTQCSESADRTNQTDQLKQIVETLASLKDDVLNVASEIREIRVDLARVNEALGSRLNVLQAMVMNAKFVKYSPTTIVMLPAAAKKSALGMIKSAFKTEYNIFFVCPVTKKVVKSGPTGKGYKYSIVKEWVKRAAPALLLTLKLVAFAAAAYGVPLPIPAMPFGSTTQALVDSMVEEIGCIVAEKIDSMTVEEHEEKKDAFESAQNALKQCEGIAALSSVKKNRVRSDVEAAMGDHVYPAIRDLLRQMENAKEAGDSWRPEHTGLKMVTSEVDGTTAWVSEEGEAAFKARGVAAFE